MPYCIVKNCKNYASKVKKEDGVSYFHFPRDRARCLVWRDIIAKSRREEYFNVKASNLVCSDHFAESDMYLTSKGLTRLKKTAVPTLQLNDEASEINEYDETTCVSATGNMVAL